jgi:hypothetical protein
MGCDFSVIVNVRQTFGNAIFYDGDLPVGPTKDFHFDCPNVDPGPAAVLMFQTRDVDHERNVIQINPATAEQPTVFGGIPLSPGINTWNGNIMLIRAGGVLRETNNELHIESRNSSGGGGGGIDAFIIDNVVVLYKTRE